MSKKALLIIDVQNELIQEKPYQKEELISTIKTLLTSCRAKGIEVIYVQHTDEELVKGSQGWEIYEEIKPKEQEKVFFKNYNSSFKKTGLKDYLDDNSIKNLIMVGMQTQYCMDTSIKVAFEYGYEILIPENGITTFNHKETSAKSINDFYYDIWNGRFAQVKPCSDILENL